MEMYISAAGSMTKQRVMVSIRTWTGQNIQDFGKKINKTGRVRRPGQMVRYTKVTIEWVESTGKAFLSGQMAHSIRDSFLITT